MKKYTAYGFFQPIREGIVEGEREVWLCIKSGSFAAQKSTSS